MFYFVRNLLLSYEGKRNVHSSKGGKSSSAAFRAPLIGDSVRYYTRCIKPNSLISMRPCWRLSAIRGIVDPSTANILNSAMNESAISNDPLQIDPSGETAVHLASASFPGGGRNGDVEMKE